MPELSVNFKIELSPKASEFIRRLGYPKELAMRIADSLNRENEDCTNEIKRVLNVQGEGKHHRGSKRGIAESESGNYFRPHKISGRLQSSIGRTSAIIEGFSGTGGISKVLASIGSGISTGGESVRYAAIQEYGGTVRVKSRPSRDKRKLARASHTWNPKTQRFSEVFRGRSGKFEAAPVTKAYSFDVPARSYVNSTISTRKDRWPKRISKVVTRFYGVND